MSHVILGLLMLRPQSLYELKKRFEAGISLFYSASTGSIKRALDQLVAGGRIEAGSESGPRGKKTYAITDAGEAEFRRWMLAELTGADLETAALARVYFLGLLESEARATVAEHVAERIRWDLARLERLEARVTAIDVPAGLEDVARFQRATLAYGLASTRTALAWADEHLPAGTGENA